jgi:hypothetical protein
MMGWMIEIVRQVLWVRSVGIGEEFLWLLIGSL